MNKQSTEAGARATPQSLNFIGAAMSGVLLVLFAVAVLWFQPSTLHAQTSATATPRPLPSPSPSASPSATATATPSDYGSQAYEREMKTPPPESPAPSASPPR